MNLLPVPSWNIFAVGFNGETRQARVVFCDKNRNPISVYDYEHVDPQQITELLFADSIGVHFQRVFKNVHTQYRKLTPEEAAPVFAQFAGTAGKGHVAI